MRFEFQRLISNSYSTTLQHQTGEVECSRTDTKKGSKNMYIALKCQPSETTGRLTLMWKQQMFIVRPSLLSMQRWDKQTCFSGCLLPTLGLFMSLLHTAFASQPNTLTGLCFVASSSTVTVNSRLSTEYLAQILWKGRGFGGKWGSMRAGGGCW